MTQTNLIDRRVQSRIIEREEDLIDELANGTAKTYDEYRWYCGLIQGLREALTIAVEIEVETDKAKESW
jgi:hypothetical protein